MSWPKEIEPLILATFGNDEQKAYGQIATVRPLHSPSVRTVHIHAVTKPESCLVVSCNTKSEKWIALEANSVIAGCYWKPAAQTQFRFDGNSKLITEENVSYKSLLLDMWLKMRAEVRTTYLLDEQGVDVKDSDISIDPLVHSKNHGIILIYPTRWDIFENNPMEYRLGKRWLYDLDKNSQWKKREVTSLHEQI